MKPLYLLLDLIDFPVDTSNLDHVVVAKSFDLDGTLVDLGFNNSENPLINQDLYTIPTIESEYSNLERGKIAKLCEENHLKDPRFSRFLVGVNNSSNKLLVKASGQKETRFEEYGTTNFKSIATRISNFSNRLTNIKKLYQAAAEAYPA